jgi:hypothetical protein
MRLTNLTQSRNLSQLRLDLHFFNCPNCLNLRFSLNRRNRLNFHFPLLDILKSIPLETHSLHLLDYLNSNKIIRHLP